MRKSCQISTLLLPSALRGTFPTVQGHMENGQAICSLEVCGKNIRPTFEQPENTLIKLQLQTGSYNAKHSQLEGSCVAYP